MLVILSAVIAGVAAALVGDMFHSAAAGFATLVVISVVFIGIAVSRRRSSPVTEG